MTEHAFAFKVMRDAIDLRQHIVRQMELAEATSDTDRRRWHLSLSSWGRASAALRWPAKSTNLFAAARDFTGTSAKKT